MAPGDVDEPLDDLLAVDRARRVVGVDDDQRVGVLGDLGLDVGEVGVPAVLLVAAVVHRLAAGERDRAGPQRVVRGRHQDLVAVVEEGLEDHRDELGDAVADEDVLDADVAQPARLVVVHHRGAGGVDALGVAVALRLRQVVDHVGEDRLGRLEAEGCGVADVELEDPVPLRLEAVCLEQDRPPDVVADSTQLLALDDGAHEGHPLRPRCGLAWGLRAWTTPGSSATAPRTQEAPMSRRTVPITVDHLAEVDEPCRSCLFWELDAVSRARLDHDERVAEKQQWLSTVLREWGSCGRAVLVDGRVAGHAIYVPAAFVPGQAALPTAPVSPDAVRADHRARGALGARRRAGPDAGAGDGARPGDPGAGGGGGLRGHPRAGGRLRDAGGVPRAGWASGPSGRT